MMDLKDDVDECSGANCQVRDPVGSECWKCWRFVIMSVLICGRCWCVKWLGSETSEWIKVEGGIPGLESEDNKEVIARYAAATKLLGCDCWTAFLKSPELPDIPKIPVREQR